MCHMERSDKNHIKYELIKKESNIFTGLMIDEERGTVYSVVARYHEEIEISSLQFYFKGDYIYVQEFPLNKILKARNWCRKAYKKIHCSSQKVE